MEITRIQSYLVQPGKGLKEPPSVVGTEIPLKGKLFEMLSDVYFGSKEECDIPIAFQMSNDGSQGSEVLTMFSEFAYDPNQTKGIPIAERLRGYTTGRSGLGLLFLIHGMENSTHRLLISRFPAEVGILADVDSDELKVEFIEQIFMKSANLYKAALFEGTSPETHFRSGHAVDKQINASNYEVAQYWIQKFLDSDYKTTSKAGSKRIALALREASRTSENLSIKNELTGVGMLIGGFDRKSVNLQQMMDSYQLSDDAQQEIISNLPYPDLKNSQFIFDYEEFQRHVAFSSVELDNGGLLIAPSDKFNNCFKRFQIEDDEDQTKFVTQGRIVDERLRGRK